mgnify:CR=1 FL=1
MADDEKFDRRGFLKFTLVSGSIILVNFIGKFRGFRFIPSVFVTTETDPYFYGTDTSWAVDTKGSNAYNFPQNFYIGRTGVGEVIYNDSSFYSVAADKAGFYFTHTYWCLKGPYYKWRGTRTAYQYGYDQATKAASAWYDHYWSAKIGGRTIFADIEEGTSNDPLSDYYDGWRYYSNGNYYVDYENNHAVLEGFLDGINEYSRNGVNLHFNPGIYTRLDLWQSWFNNASYDPGRSYVVWLAGNACTLLCSPCGTCTTAKTEANNKFHTMRDVSFGKYKTIIWQFFTSECPAPDCADYDISRQHGEVRFSPLQVLHLPIIRRDIIPVDSIGSTDMEESYPSSPNPYP